MAVLQPDAYAGIQNALKQRADLASNAPPSTLGIAAKAVGQAGGAAVGTAISDEHQKDLEKFKFNLEDQLKQNEAKYKAAGEGKSLRTQQDINDHYTQMGLDPTLAPKLPKEGVYMSEQDIQSEMKHAQFRTQVQKVADQYSSSKDPADQRRASFLKIVSSLPDDKLENVTGDLRKILVPESDVSKNADKPIGKDKDTLGRTRWTYNDGTEKVIPGATKPLKQGEVAKQQANLEPAELDTFKKGLNDFDTKTLKDSKTAFHDLDKLETIVKDNNPAAFFNSKIGLVKIGGVTAGRMAQGEIVQDAGSRAAFDKLQQKVETFKQGDWTPQNKKLILDYIGSLRQFEQEHIQNQLEDASSKTLSSMPDPTRIDPEFIKKEFRKPIEKYLPDAEAEDLLKSAGKAVTPAALKIARKVLDNKNAAKK